ncbi:glycosyltransferase family 2 protein [Tardiphaga robiniae]|uniref:Glycosyltransferase family 2 protein n=1 Tax=Tardiphaga robiniae TaxID=943830 RepID=A0A7G6TUN5_9BRAD|nr:glycosyltransferase family 2 protein [Tardiphaga robiniae]QND70467.1 glycosyltransferase family 2 protein [Tardiphaga robiniae]
MNLLIVIVNFRVAPLVVDCLRSIEAELPAAPDTHVVVLENGSNDGSDQIIADAIRSEGWANWCLLDVSTENLGFTGGNNRPIGAAMRGENPPTYVWLLNPDTVVRPGALAALVAFMAAHPKVGIAGSRLEDPDGTAQRSAFRFKTPLGEFEGHARIGPLTRLLNRYVVAPPVIDHAAQTDWVAGASMIVRREVFSDAGLLDEGYFTYFDDIDFCLAARHHGWATWYVPQSRVVHLVGQSTGVNAVPRRVPSYMLDARRRFFLKNYSPLYALLVDSGMLLGIAIARVRARLSRKPDLSPPHMLRDYFNHSIFVRGFAVPVVKSPA